MVLQFDPDCRAVIDDDKRSNDAVERVLQDVQNKRAISFSQSFNYKTFISYFYLIRLEH